VLANTYENRDLSDIMLIRLDDSFQAVWSSPVFLGGDGEDTAAAVVELPDGHVVVLGNNEYRQPGRAEQNCIDETQFKRKLAE